VAPAAALVTGAEPSAEPGAEIIVEPEAPSLEPAGQSTARSAPEPALTNFVLTTEWQEVPEDVELSAPVHVRLHRRTGKKLAKLVDLESLEDLPNAHLFVVSP
jgi:hypothetical protein